MDKRGIDDHLSEGKDLSSFKDADPSPDAIRKERDRIALSVRHKILEREVLLSVNDTFYRMQTNAIGGGYYRRIDDREIAIAIERTSRKLYTRKLCGDVVDMLHNSCHLKREKINSDKRSINVLNGVLSIETRELRAFTKDDLYTYQIPIIYDPRASCPEWDRFLNETFEDCPGNVQLMQSICGYCLQTAKNSEKFFVFFGTGGNGKGVVTHVIENVLGLDNCTSLGLEKLGDSQWNEMLVDKMLNLATESDSRASKWSETMKIAVSGEALVVNPKYKDRYKFYPFAKHIITMNDRPYLEDKSDGIMRRMIIVPFNKKVDEEDMDIGLKRRLVEIEGSGILNWFLDGLGMYLKDSFIIPDENKALAREIKVESNSVMMYFEDEYEAVPFSGDWVGTEDFYHGYVDYCKKNGYKSFSKCKVTRCLASDYGIDCKLKRIENQVFRVYKDILKK